MDAERANYILLHSGQPERVIAHCRRVAALAETLAQRLNACGLRLDAGLCWRGGLLHDVQRTLRRHAEAGAHYLLRLGYPDEARIAREHLGDLDPHILNESAVVCLADKLICGQQRCTVRERFARSEAKYAGDAATLTLLQARRAVALELERAVEALLGAPC